jgi:selenocysteine lyase/cysteine desulfurase
MQAESLYGTPNALASHYSRFRVADRLLLTGHSLQAWPDCSFDAQQQAWLDTAKYVDDVWPHAFEKADRVRRGYAALLGDADGSIALAESTHELLIRLFSALPLRDRPRFVTSTGEFHAVRRQMDRFEEAGIEVARVELEPVETLTERMAAAVDDRTCAVIVSSVLFRSARIVPHLDVLAAACRRTGAALIVDAYHHLNVVPFDLHDLDLDDAFVVGGGYKYCQLGQGNAFLRIPPDLELRPVITGWFSEFTALTAKASGSVQYGVGGDRFAGGTYDPTPHYRGARVFDFFIEHGLTPTLLREVYQHQVGVLAAAFDRLDADPRMIDRDRTVRIDQLAGFLALRTARAGELHDLLRKDGVFTDYRGDVLRFGPAPYLSDAQLEAAMTALGAAISSISS